jgi:hypothetical protein
LTLTAIKYNKQYAPQQFLQLLFPFVAKHNRFSFILTRLLLIFFSFCSPDFFTTFDKFCLFIDFLDWTLYFFYNNYIFYEKLYIFLFERVKIFQEKEKIFWSGSKEISFHYEQFFLCSDKIFWYFISNLLFSWNFLSRLRVLFFFLFHFCCKIHFNQFLKIVC